MAEETTFEALYRIQKDGSRVWLIQLENSQFVAITDDDIRLYPNKDNVSDEKLLGKITRRVKGDDKPDDSKAESAKPQRLL